LDFDAHGFFCDQDSCPADKWVGTAYEFYGVKEATEPAGGLDEQSFVSCGASQLFTQPINRRRS